MMEKRKIPVPAGNLTTLVQAKVRMLLAGVLLGLLFDPGRLKQYILLKRR
jgi:hypothetical protein